MNLVELILLAAIWGASFLFMRVAAPAFGPIPLMALRVGIAMLVLAPVLHAGQARQQIRAHLWPLLVVGLTNSALPFCLLAYAALSVNAGLDSVLNATTPLWAAVIAAVAFRTPMRRAQVAGLLIGLAGVVVLVWDTLASGAAGVPLAIVSALGGALSYGFAVIYSKRRFAGVMPEVAAFGSQWFAAVILWPLAAFTWPQHAIGASSWACVAALGVVCTALAYLLYFRLIARAGAAYAASVTFLVPIFALVWGALFLDEKLTPTVLVGCVIILLGTSVASGNAVRLLPRRS